MDFRIGSDFVNVEPELCPDAIEEWLLISRKIKKKEDGMSRLDLTTRAKKHLSALGWVFWYATKGQKRELRYESPEGKLFYSLATACESCLNRDTENTGKLGFLRAQGSSGSYKGSPISTLTEETDNNDFGTRSGKISSELKTRKRQGAESEDRVENDEAVMIHDGIRKSARKIRKQNDGKDEWSIMQSKRTEKDKDDESVVKPGIGKSLVILKKLQIVNEKANKQPRRSSRRAHHISNGSMTTNDMNDDICSVCHYGGDLVLCDACPSAFHVNCLGLKGLPEEDSWFCPSCCCRICKSAESIDDSFIICEQCQTRFHFGCLEQQMVASYKGWFCSIKCEQLFSSLQSLVGKEIRVGDDNNFAWRLLKPPADDDDGYGDTNADLISKLHRAVKVIHDCFEPSQDSFTGRDMVEDVIFARKSHLKRLNFSGFYTIVLERNKRLITVAAVRIFRDVVEVPLVATVMRYRKRGMCRALMNELERQMADMGVYKIVLPSAASVLSTWTESFGFSIMEDFERMKLLNHSFLDFQGTVMCQKVLMRRPDSAKSAIIDESFEMRAVDQL